jgi:hypothetical protein
MGHGSMGWLMRGNLIVTIIAFIINSYTENLETDRERKVPVLIFIHLMIAIIMISLLRKMPSCFLKRTVDLKKIDMI